MDTGCLLVYVTMPDAASARVFCETLVRERFAAGVTMLGGVESVYWWHGALETAAETACLFQTTRERFPAFLEKAKVLHPYDVPCIVAWTLEAGNSDFFDWIGAQSTP